LTVLRCLERVFRAKSSIYPHVLVSIKENFVKQIRQRLTYANVMSSLAVFMVLGGATAFAATKIGANQLKANSVLTGKIKKEAVTAGKIKKNAIVTAKIADKAVTGPKVDTATLGTVPTATNATNATHASTADTATTAAPRAFARVIAGGDVDEPRAKGVTDAGVTLVGGSAYCFELGFTPTNIQATVDWTGGGANTFAQATLEPFVICPDGTDASVRTTNNAGAGINTISFFVSFVG
jgi:hypothetical protein